MTQNLTQEYLKSILKYDPEIGRFFWIAARKKTTVGKMAGCIKKDAYRCIRIGGRDFLEHRLVWLHVNGEMPNDQIDHVNHIRDDNRIENLRAVSNQENGRNRSKSKNNTSGVTGVSWHKGVNKWQAQINVGGKHKHLEYFEHYFEAICARKSAELHYVFHENHGA